MTILLVAGEASGDVHGARLAAALHQHDPSAQLVGAGGEAMRAAGVELLYPLTQLAAVGIADVLRRLPAYHRVMRRLEAFLDAERPDAVVLIDFPGFNLRLADRVKRRGIRLVYYISPQLWAWKPGRMRVIQRTVDQMLVILPFEETLYRQAGVPVAFVGHPLLDAPPPAETPGRFRQRLRIPPDHRLIALLPGSRSQEVAAHWPMLVHAARLITEQLGGAVRFLLIKAPSLDAAWPWPESARCGSLTIVDGEAARRSGLAAADLALVCSGTATLEAAILERPMVIFYRTSLFNWLAFRPLVRIPSIGLVNVVAGRRIVPELVQFAFTPARVAEAAVRLLQDDRARGAMQAALRETRAKLGTPGAAARAAEIILETAKSVA